ncbi:MAG TPA: PIG-L family deacetylase [Bryobacteraceae bacterium]|jgi:LmbE family N-acetylglucosaminyl deacetylase|nr:PIG-L family deacetylase [Bryobacteraceae bacterium]
MIIRPAFLTFLAAASMYAQADLSSLTADRFKADLLLVVAHPDDETAAGSYLARAIFDQHKRLAVVFGTHGNSGGDEVGQQQAASLAEIREIEGRRALAYFGVTNVWFLQGPDTPGQDVLRSLETWDHGRSLGELVRIVRLTRPSVIVTWLPDYVAGENHGDHQTAGVLATEAFDIAGDPTQYPEQVTPPRDAKGISNLTEGLHPWQAEKIYYFSDASHTEFLKNQGPAYAATDVSPSKNVNYARLAAESGAFHLTQSDSGYAAAVALQKNDVEHTYFQQPDEFIFGKAYVPGDVTSDIFAGVQDQPLPYHAPPGFHAQASNEIALELGGPWHFYTFFWRAHALDHLASLVPPEILAGISTDVFLPLLINNPSSESLSGKLSVELPDGWSQRPHQSLDFHVAPGETWSGSVTVVAPSRINSNWESIRISAKAGSRAVGSVVVRTQVTRYSLPQ